VSPQEAWLRVATQRYGDQQGAGVSVALGAEDICEVLRQLDKPVSAHELAYIVDTLAGPGNDAGDKLVPYVAFERWWLSVLKEFAAWCEREDKKSTAAVVQPADSSPKSEGELAAAAEAQHAAELADAVQRSKQEADADRRAAQKRRKAVEAQRWAAHIRAKQAARVVEHRQKEAANASRADEKKVLVAALEAKHNRMVSKKSFAAVLKELGVTPEGWPHPTAEQLHQGYRRALREFHPDRAQRRLASWQAVVEAEELYKLLQTLYDRHNGQQDALRQQKSEKEEREDRERRHKTRRDAAQGRRRAETRG
jgi:hypothetical protein